MPSIAQATLPAANGRKRRRDESGSVEFQAKLGRYVYVLKSRSCIDAVAKVVLDRRPFPTPMPSSILNSELNHISLIFGKNAGISCPNRNVHSTMT